MHFGSIGCFYIHPMNCAFYFYTCLVLPTFGIWVISTINSGDISIFILVKIGTCDYVGML